MNILNGIEVFCHSSIKIKKDITIYIDPYKIDKEYNTTSPTVIRFIPVFS